MHLHIRRQRSESGPWNAISWDDGPRLKSVLFELPIGTFLLNLRGQLYHLTNIAPVPKSAGECWSYRESTADTVAKFCGLFEGHFAGMDSIFDEGFSAAATLLARDSRLGLDCIVAVLSARGPLARRNRAQALLDFPLLASILAKQKSPRLKVEFTADRIATTIDQGHPLIPELVEAFQCKAWVWRRLRKLVAADVQPYTSLSQLVENVAAMSPERAPAPPGFALLAHLFSDSLAHPWVRAVAHRSILRAGWPEFGTRVARMSELMDYTRFVENLLMRAGANSTDRIGLLDGYLGSPTLGQLDELSRRWHEIEEALEEPAENQDPRYQDPDALSWRPLLDEPVSHKGLTFRSLADRASLREEGNAMKHCVGSYTARCASGETHILGITRDGKRLATAEVSPVLALPSYSSPPTAGRFKMEVHQVKGKHNAACAPETLRALVEVLDRLPQSHLQTFHVVRRRDPGLPDRDVTARFESAVQRLGDEALGRYRGCLQVSASKSALWEAVWNHFSAGSAKAALKAPPAQRDARDAVAGNHA